MTLVEMSPQCSVCGFPHSGLCPLSRAAPEKLLQEIVARDAELAALRAVVRALRTSAEDIPTDAPQLRRIRRDVIPGTTAERVVEALRAMGPSTSKAVAERLGLQHGTAAGLMSKMKRRGNLRVLRLDGVASVYALAEEKP